MRDLIIRKVSIDWDKITGDSYLRKIDALKNLDHIELESNIVIFCGENGSGKSTLLEAIAVNYGFNPEGGTRNYNFATYDSHSQLCDAIRLTRGINKPGWGYFLRAESFYNVASAEEEYSRVGGVPQHYHEKSHGESFLQLAQTNFRSHGLYILDEPEAALSPQRQLTLLMEIVNCAREDSQFIMVTHSPILLGIPDAQILSFDDGRVHQINYEDTESYQITKLFIENRQQLLKRMLNDPVNTREG